MQDIPYGYCQCGCGQKTRVPKYADRRHGYVRDEPVRFVRGHRIRQPTETRFWEKVDKRAPNGCWVWTAAPVNTGYGRFRDEEGRKILAHRFSYELLVGPIPDGLPLDHLCMNKLCVNPAHLEPVTAAENVRRWAATITHCPRGHLYAGDNLRIDSQSGAKRCRTCERALTRARRAAKK